MRKSLIITIAAALLLCAVLCTAGCVENKTADPAVGDWFANDDDTLTIFSVYEDGTGAYVIAKAQVSASGEAGYVTDEESTFVWAKNADGTYLVSFADGDTFTAAVDAKFGILTLDDGSVFEKQPNVLSGVNLNGMLPAYIYANMKEKHPDGGGALAFYFWIMDNWNATEEEMLAKANEIEAEYYS